jgi:hypothetical protein
MGEFAIHTSLFHDFSLLVRYIRSIIKLLQFLLLYVYVFATFILQAPVFGSADLSARPIAVTFVDEHIASSLNRGFVELP